MTNTTTAAATQHPGETPRPRDEDHREEPARSNAEPAEKRSTDEQVTAYDHLWFRRRPIQ